MSFVVCPICEGAAAPRTDGQPAYWRCSACGTAFLEPQPSAADVAAYYESFHGIGQQPGSFAPFETRMALDVPVKCQIVANLLGGRRHARLLDVGCGKGFFVAEALTRGFDAHGIDISATAIEAGRKRFGLGTLRSGLLGDQLDWRGQFDVVTAWATVEHLRDPCGFVVEVGACLKPGGLLILDTGLAGDFIDEWLPGLTQWYAPSEHMFVFSEAGLRVLLEKAGFDVVYVDRSFERSRFRRWTKTMRNVTFAFAAHALFRVLLGLPGVEQARKEAKLPLGSLIMIGARLRTVVGEARRT